MEGRVTNFVVLFWFSRSNCTVRLDGALVGRARKPPLIKALHVLPCLVGPTARLCALRKHRQLRGLTRPPRRSPSAHMPLGWGRIPTTRVLLRFVSCSRRSMPLVVRMRVLWPSGETRQVRHSSMRPETYGSPRVHAKSRSGGIVKSCGSASPVTRLPSLRFPQPTPHL